MPKTRYWKAVLLAAAAPGEERPGPFFVVRVTRLVSVLRRFADHDASVTVLPSTTWEETVQKMTTPVTRKDGVIVPRGGTVVSKVWDIDPRLGRVILQHHPPHLPLSVTTNGSQQQDRSMPGKSAPIKRDEL